jgi:hypothetical protein
MTRPKPGTRWRDRYTGETVTIIRVDRWSGDMADCSSDEPGTYWLAAVVTEFGRTGRYERVGAKAA